jgi:hypothetical protein
MRFKWLSGDIDFSTYGGKWISKQLDAGLFNYWLVMELLNLEDLGCRDEGDGMYEVSLQAVSLDLLSTDKLEELVDNFGQEWFQDHFQSLDEKTQLEIMVDEASTYGYGANIWAENGNNFTKLMKDMRARADHIAEYPWAYIGDITNGFGANGFDMMRGERIYPQRYPEIDEETEEYISNLGDGLRNFTKYIEDLRKEYAQTE